MMNKNHLFAASAAIAVTAVAMPAQAATPFFTDVKEGNALYPEIKDLHEQGKINGFKDGTFRPQESVTRGQAAKMIADLLELNTTSPKAPNLKDVKQDKWYYGAIAALVEAKIMGGFTDGMFRPDQTLTRAEASRLIGEAFKLSNEGNTVAFSDVKKEKWYYTYVQSLVHNKVTAGKTATTFAPDANVTRGELVAFASRAKKATTPAEKTKKVESVENGKITIAGQTYTASESVKGLLQAANQKALTGAEIEFTEKNGVIESIEHITLKSAGTEAAPVVLDGQGAVLTGNVTVDSDNVELKNMTINGDLTVTATVKTSFATDKLTVLGTTSIQEGTTAAAAAENPVTRIKITFKDSTVAVIEIAKKDIYFSASGSTKVTSISLFANADIFADEDVIIPKVDIKQGVTRIELNATIQDVVIDSNDDIQVSGKGNFSNVIVNTDKKVTLATTGAIQNLDMKNEKATLNVGDNAKITNISVPAGQDVSKMIDNYDAVKNNIEQVGGEKNPDITPVTPPPSSGGGSTGPVTPPDETPDPETDPDEETGDYFAAGMLEVKERYGYVKLNIKNPSENGKVYYQQLKRNENTSAAKEGDVISTDAVEYKTGDELVNWFDIDLVVYQTDANGKIIDVVDVEERWYGSMIKTVYQENGTLTLKLLIDPAGRSVEEVMDYLYIYQNDAIQKWDDFSSMTWGEEDGIPTLTFEAPELAKDVDEYLILGTVNNGLTSLNNRTYDNEALKIKVIHDLAKDESGTLRGYEFQQALQYVAYEQVEKTDAGGGKYFSHEFTGESDSVSIKAYKQEFIQQPDNLQTEQAILDMIESVDAELKTKVDVYKAAREAVNALYKEDRYDYPHEESLLDETTLEDIEAAAAKVAEMDDAFQEKQQLIRDIENAEFILLSAEVEQFKNTWMSTGISVPAEAETGSDLTSSILTEQIPAFLTETITSAGSRVRTSGDYQYVNDDSSYLAVQDDKLILTRPNKTGETITQYVSVELNLGNRYMGLAIIPVKLLSSERDESTLSSVTAVNVLYNQNGPFFQLNSVTKTIIASRGTSVEQLFVSLQAEDYSVQSYALRNAEGAEKTTGFVAEGDILTVRAENGSNADEYTIKEGIYLKSLEKQALGHFSFTAENTSAEELLGSMTLNLSDEGEVLTITSEGDNRYTAVIENAKIEKEYSLQTTESHIFFQNSSSIAWRSFSLNYESQNYPYHTVVIKEETESVSIDSAEEVMVSFTDYYVDQALPGMPAPNTITYDGVTITPVVAERADGSYKIAFTSEGTDLGESDETRHYPVTVSIDGIDNKQIGLQIDGSGYLHISIAN